ncbi:MAG: hypothetical protein RLZZ172_634 [Bacteroidota bacterium]|jgi:hypothetical protein
MVRKFVDISQFQARKMEIHGNVDRFYWHDKTLETRLSAAAEMNAIAFNEPEFIFKKVDKSFYSSRKHNAIESFQ